MSECDLFGERLSRDRVAEHAWVQQEIIDLPDEAGGNAVRVDIALLDNGCGENGRGDNSGKGNSLQGEFHCGRE